jgi:hypothetical protein
MFAVSGALSSYVGFGGGKKGVGAGGAEEVEGANAIEHAEHPE